MNISEATESDLQQEIYKRNKQRLELIPKGSTVHPKMRVYEVYDNLLKNRHWNENTAVCLNDLKLWVDVIRDNHGRRVEFSGLNIKSRNDTFRKNPVECIGCEPLLEELIKGIEENDNEH
jgi:alpha-L-fucosidase